MPQTNLNQPISICDLSSGFEFIYEYKSSITQQNTLLSHAISCDIIKIILISARLTSIWVKVFPYCAKLSFHFNGYFTTHSSKVTSPSTNKS